MENITCPICLNPFNMTVQVPIVLHCGHTFCQDCVSHVERKMGALNCPHCLGRDYREISSMKRNYFILQNIETSTVQPMAACQDHPEVESFYYCLDEKAPFCAKCATKHKAHDFYDINDPVITQGTDIHLKEARDKAEDNLRIVVQQKKRSMKIFEQLQGCRSAAASSVEKAFSTIESLLQEKKNGLLNSLNVPLNPLMKRLQETVETLDTFIVKKQKALEGIDNLNRNMAKYSGVERISKLKELNQIDFSFNDKDAALTQIEIETTQLELTRYIDVGPALAAIQLLSPEVSGQPRFVWNPQPVLLPSVLKSPLQVQLVQYLLQESIHMAPKTREILESTDRKDFMPAESSPYEDRPQRIGYNTTISAPHMHAMTLEMLAPYLRRDIKVLDVGCGSGYLTICLAKYIEQGQVFGIDHIEEIINQAMDNIQKTNMPILHQEDIEFTLLHRDGRLGLPEHAPFDVIHVGAATAQVPPALFEQLALGGVLIAPVGPVSSHQRIMIFTKDSDGELSSTPKMTVNYAPLTDRDKQCRFTR